MRENDMRRTKPLTLAQALLGLDGSGDVGVSSVVE